MVTHAPLRIVFFGTPEFAVPTLEALLASRHLVVGVVTQPDRPRGRGHQLSRAREGAGDVAEHPRAAAGEDARRGVSRGAADSRRRPRRRGGVRADPARRLLAMPRLGMINVHASLLPRYRGAAPVHRAVIAGDGRPASRSCASFASSTPGRCSRWSVGRLPPTRPAPRSSGACEPRGAPGGDHRREAVTGAGHRRAATRHRRHLRRPHHERRRACRLVARGARSAQSGPRTAALAAGVHVDRRTPPAPREDADVRGPRAGVGGSRHGPRG